MAVVIAIALAIFYVIGSVCSVIVAVQVCNYIAANKLDIMTRWWTRGLFYIGMGFLSYGGLVMAMSFKSAVKQYEASINSRR